MAQSAQPSSDFNRIWIPTAEQTEVQVPTYEEFNQLSQSVITDSSLIVAGKPADAKETGRRLNTLDITSDTLLRKIYATPRKSADVNGYFALSKTWRYSDGTQDSRQTYKDRSVVTYALDIADSGTRITIDPVENKNYVFNILCYSSSSISSTNFVYSPTGAKLVPAGTNILVEKINNATHFIVQIRNLGNEAEDAAYQYYKTLSNSDITEIQAALKLFNYTDLSSQNKNIENYLKTEYHQNQDVDNYSIESLIVYEFKIKTNKNLENS